MARVRSGTTAGGADKASLEIEMQNSLGATPELSAVPPYESRSLNDLKQLKDDAQKLGTKWPLVLVLVIFVALSAACLGGGLWITQQHNESLAVLHSAELKATQQQHSAELEAARTAAPRSVGWAITNGCGEPSPACVGQVNHGCGPKHNGVACAQGLFCQGRRRGHQGGDLSCFESLLQLGN